MKVDVVDLKKEKVGEAELDESIFAVPVKEGLLWEVVNWQRARRRAGTHQAKGRSAVRGGGRKPWRQKGTGRARQGSIRAPQWVGGGVVHGPTTRDHSYSMPKKKRRAALRSVLSLKVRDGKILVVDNFDFEQTKTKYAVGVLAALQAPKALLVDATSRDESTGKVAHNEALRLSVRNLPRAKYLAAEGLNVEDVLRYDTLVLSQQALDHIHEVLKR